MDSNKCSAQVERFEVVETGRRRRWTDDEKLKIVLESLQTPRAVSSTARRYGISRSLLTRWDAFTRFLDEGGICLSNNTAERALRGIALGRKSWLFCGSDRGGHRAAMMYSLI